MLVWSVGQKNHHTFHSKMRIYINSSAARGSGNVLSIPCRQQTHPLMRTSSSLGRETEEIRSRITSNWAEKQSRLDQN